VGASDGDLKGSATLPSSFGLYCRPVAPHPRGLLAFKGLPPALFVLLSPVLHHSHHGVGDAAPPPPRGRIVYVSESRSATACLNDSLVVRIIVGYEYKIFRSSFFFSSIANFLFEHGLRESLNMNFITQNTFESIYPRSSVYDTVTLPSTVSFVGCVRFLLT
jgi:hypothetical protein